MLTQIKNKLNLKATHVMCNWKEECWDEKINKEKRGAGRGGRRKDGGGTIRVKDEQKIDKEACYFVNQLNQNFLKIVTYLWVTRP